MHQKLSPINNDSTLPMLVNFNLTTSLNQTNFNVAELFRIIQNLDIIKRYYHDNLSMKIKKTCDLAIIQPLPLILTMNKSVYIAKSNNFLNLTPFFVARVKSRLKRIVYA